METEDHLISSKARFSALARNVGVAIAASLTACILVGLWGCRSRPKGGEWTEPPPRHTQREPVPEDSWIYPVYFGTDRSPLVGDDPSKGFGSGRGHQMYYGTCLVGIPKSHQIGSIGSSWGRRNLRGIDDRLKVLSVTTYGGRDKFLRILGSELSDCPGEERGIFLYIHGYRTSFDEAVIRAAQIGCDLQVGGVAAAFSWPSGGELADYIADKAAAETSETRLKEFLVDLVEKTGAAHVDILAHSMGNEILIRTLDRLASEKRFDTVKFRNIFLAAPDVDRDKFCAMASNYARCSRRTTLYVSSRDKALELSGWLQNYARAGYCPPLTIEPGIDTIDASLIDFSYLGHGYYAEAKAVLQDIKSLLLHDSDPSVRAGIEPVNGQSEMSPCGDFDHQEPLCWKIVSSATQGTAASKSQDLSEGIERGAP